jgi:hypothetical protein
MKAEIKTKPFLMKKKERRMIEQRRLLGYG